MRIPCGESVTWLAGMQRGPRVDVFLIEHVLDRVARDVTAAEPNHCADPLRHARDLQDFAGCERVEVAGNDVEAVLVLFDRLEERADLVAPLPLAPIGEPGAQVQTKQPYRWFFDFDFEKSVLGVTREMPIVFGDWQSAQKTCRVINAGIPMRHPGELGEFSDDQPIGCFLQEHNVRMCGTNYGGDLLGASGAAEFYVVAKQPKSHGRLRLTS